MYICIYVYIYIYIYTHTFHDLGRKTSGYFSRPTKCKRRLKAYGQFKFTSRNFRERGGAQIPEQLLVLTSNLPLDKRKPPRVSLVFPGGAFENWPYVSKPFRPPGHDRDPRLPDRSARQISGWRQLLLAVRQVSYSHFGGTHFKSGIPTPRLTHDPRQAVSHHQAAPNISMRLRWACHFCACRARRGNSQCLAKSSPYAGLSAGTEGARLWKWHVSRLLIIIVITYYNLLLLLLL